MGKRRLTWLAGGIGLIACGVIGVLRGSVFGIPSLDVIVALIADLLWAAAVLLLTIGLNREGSVVARRPLGLAASAVVAIWPLVTTVVGVLSGPIDPEQVDAWLFWGYLATLLPLIAGLVAAVQVSRAQTIPRPWNWAPLWVLAGQAALWALPQLLGVAAPEIIIRMPGLTGAFGTLAFLASTFGLGVLAIVLANRSRAGTVEVLQSPPLE